MMNSWRRMVGAMVLAVLGAAAQVAAQVPDGMVPVRPGDVVETLPATPLVFAAYAFVWATLIVYVFVIWRRLGRVEQELGEVNAQLRARKRP